MSSSYRGLPRTALILLGAALLHTACRVDVGPAHQGDPPAGRATQALAGAPAFPCVDPRGCPDLTVSQIAMGFRPVLDSRLIRPTECSVDEGAVQPGARRLLRFNLATANIGAGVLHLGRPADRPDLFDLATCHGHPHLDHFADFRLWTPADYAAWEALRAANPGVTSGELLARNPLLRAKVVGGGKHASCLADIVPCDFALPVGCPAGQPIDFPPAYPLICAVAQGISVGWVDLYQTYLDAQWVEVTNLAGTFVLEAEVNGERIFAESDYGNNRAVICVNIPPRAGHVPFTPDPGCVDPTPMNAPGTCELCLFNCAGLPGCCASAGCLCGVQCGG
jgi:hypothetical protein